MSGQLASTRAAELADQSRLLDTTDASRMIQSGLLAVEAARNDASLEADQALRRYLDLAPLPIAKVSQGDNAYEVHVAFSPGGKYGAKPKDCDGKRRLPGCNNFGYFYRGVPPAGSDAGFNAKEDFAESVTACVYPFEAKRRVDNIISGLKKEDPSNYSKIIAALYYDSYSDTGRWAFINALIH